MTVKRTQVVMLPTNEKAKLKQLVLGKHGTLKECLSKEGIPEEYEKDWTAQHLYFLSDEPIQEGDLVYDLAKVKVVKYNKESCSDHCKKILASTDSSLMCIKGQMKNGSYLPQPSQDFIKAYVDAYNTGKPIEYVNVEFEEISDNKTNNFGKKQIYYQKLKVNSKNEITIRKIKDSYTREEVIELINKYKTDYPIHRNIQVLSYEFDKWISDNH